MSPLLAVLNVAAIVVLSVIGIVRGKTGNVAIKTSLWAATGENEG